MKVGVAFYIVLAFCMFVTVNLTVFTRDESASLASRAGMFILLSIMSVVMALIWSEIARKVGKLFSDHEDS